MKKLSFINLVLLSFMALALFYSNVLSASIPHIQKIDKSLPEPHVLQSIFKKSGLAERLSGWDQFEKDSFYLRVKNFSIETLQQRYPMFKKEQISKLKKQIRDESKKASTLKVEALSGKSLN